MLRSNGLLRAVTALLTVCLALQSATPPSGHACPMHGAAVTAPPADVPPAESHHAHGAHGALTTAHAAGHAPAFPGDIPAPPCDCATDCCGVPTVALAVASPRLPVVAVLAAQVAPRTPAARRIDVPVRLLPFPNGPPGLPVG